jgi:methylated-DNA-[protein]-cysteine S-methyltransferase
VTLLLSTLATPIGNLNLIADEHILLGANLSTLKALKESLSYEDAKRDIKSVCQRRSSDFRTYQRLL